MNGRPSMDISNPLRLSDAPSGTRRCVCRDMDGEEHCHVHSEAYGGEDTDVDVVDGLGVWEFRRYESDVF